MPSPGRVGRRGIWPILALAVVLTGALAGCGSSGAASPTPSAASASASASASAPEPRAADVVYLALGDSNVYGVPSECGSCTTYPHLVREQLAKRTSRSVELLDGSQHNRLDAARLLDELKTDSWQDDSALPVRIADQTPRAAVAAADLITITVSANDIPWYQSTDPCGSRYGEECVRDVQQPFAQALDGALAEIARIRAGKETTVLVTTFYNDLLKGPHYDPNVFFTSAQVARGPGEARVFLDRWNGDICAIATRHGARCADTYHAINGADGRTPLGAGYFSRDAGDLNQKGQDRFAEVVLKSGLAPVALTV